MANTTIRGAQAVHGQNPQSLIEYTIRMRIYESDFWKEHCFALTAATLIDKALELDAIGGVYGGNQKPTQFLCLLLKLLQIQPEKEIVVEYLRADEFKYLRALAVMYIRMTFRANEVYDLLEPLMKDYRNFDHAGHALTYFDSFIDDLLRDDRVCDIILPRIPKRDVLEEAGELGPRKSTLLDAMEGREDAARSRSGSPSGSEPGSHKSRSHSRSQSPVSEKGRSRSRSPNGDEPPVRPGSAGSGPARFRSRTRSVSPDRFRSRSRSISPDRMDQS
ncbi:PRP38 family-domain-containing protein [Auriculariales sp. MPI-PUGE-AT-0066]|nr:PRP38 family-domain-containing protein [Auriculariales sp. MPI-PUGE-AT-0066]